MIVTVDNLDGVQSIGLLLALAVGLLNSIAILWLARRDK